MDNIYLQIPLKQQDVSDLVLATVTRTTGSTPQKPGSSAIFSRDGLIRGTVGGGILEARVQERSKNSISTKSSGHYLFKLDNSIADGEDALCGGQISVLIDSDPGKHIRVFEAIRESSASGIAGVLVTMVTYLDTEKVHITRFWEASGSPFPVPGELRIKAESLISEMINASDSFDFREIELEEPGKKPSSVLFLESVLPPSQLIIAGAGHIGKALARIADMLDFEITVIDDRPEFACRENIQNAHHIIADNIGKTIAGIDKRRDTFIVIVTRGHRDDSDALRACIGSEAGYIGMIGSRNKIALMRKEFIEKGWATREQWERIFAPVGIEIRSQTVGEIAVSIAAQLVQVRNSGVKSKKAFAIL